MEETKWLKPSDSVSRYTVTARVCRPAEFMRARVAQWEAAKDISARTAQRYRQLVENQIVPHLGAKALQKLRPLDIEDWHTALRSSGRVRGQGGVAHAPSATRIASWPRRCATRTKTTSSRNVAKLQSGSQGRRRREMVIVQDVPALVAKLAGSACTSRPWWRCSPACVSARYWRCDGTASISIARLLRFAKRWSKPRHTAPASSCRSPKPAGGISPCRISWSMRYGNIERPARTTDAARGRALTR